MNVIDPNNPIPKYLQISAWIRELIQSGRYEKGASLPSEVELARICQVNRNTLRQAISELSTAGVLRREKGRGTFVCAETPLAITHKLKSISSFSADLHELGIREKTRIVKKGQEEAKEQVAKKLILGPNAKVVAIRRLRTGNDVPFIYEESFLPATKFSEILKMDLTGSMYQIIDECFNVTLARSDQTIRAINLKGRIASYLGLPENSAAFFMESLTFDENNIPVELLHSYYRGDKYVFEVELGRYHIEEDKVHHD
ncbi:MAG: GntR family transcriptional regulator [Deltaproteobacteria bacterium]|nr:GntR family transcriptional regulator [Deltaproteobacteria bacterium]